MKLGAVNVKHGIACIHAGEHVFNAADHLSFL